MSRSSQTLSSSPSELRYRCDGPFSVGVVPWQRRLGETVFTVVVKATYALEPELCPLLDEPEAVQEDDGFWDDDADRSLYAPSDLALMKPASEVIVLGHAYAPDQRPAYSIHTRVAVGTIDKVVEACAQRRFDREGRIERSPAAARLPLHYEAAAGGAGTDNPVGIDPTDIGEGGRRRVPGVLPPNLEVRPGEHISTIGFGPIAPHWPPRAKLLRPQDRGWLKDPRARPMPEGFDPRYFCVAPVDQRAVEPFRVDERIILEGLSPQHPRLVTNLAGVAPQIFFTGPKAPAAPQLAADLLRIDTDRGVATLTFRAHVAFDGVVPGVGIVISTRGDQDASHVYSIPKLTDEATSDLPALGPLRGSLDAAPLSVAAVRVDPLEMTHVENTSDLPGGPALPFSPAAQRDLRERMASQPDGHLPFRSIDIDDPTPMPPDLSESDSVVRARPAPSSLSSSASSTVPQGNVATPSSHPTTPPPPMSAPVTSQAPVAAASSTRGTPPALPSAPQASRPPMPPPPTSVRSSVVPAPMPAPLPALRAQRGPEAGGSVAPAPPPMGAPFGALPASVVIPQPRASTLGERMGSSSPLPANEPLRSPPATPQAPPSRSTSDGELKADPLRARDPFQVAFGRNGTAQPAGEERRIAPFESAKDASDSALFVERRDPTARDRRATDAISSGVRRRAMVDLLCFDPSVTRRLRRSRSHAETLVDFNPPRAPRRPDEPDADRDREERGRLEVLRVLSCGAPIEPSELGHAIDRCLDDPNDLELPLFLVSGELRPTFDELEALRAAVGVAQPLAGSDKRVQSAVAVANDALSSSTPPLRQTAFALYRSLENAVQQLSLGPRYLSEQVEHSLLTQRHYRKPVILGEARIRAEIAASSSSGSSPFPVYLPESVGARLPMLNSFPVVALCELHPKQDAGEQGSEALLVCALGRVVRAARSSR